jgi:hypothetical protein
MVEMRITLCFITMYSFRLLSCILDDLHRKKAGAAAFTAIPGRYSILIGTLPTSSTAEVKAAHAAWQAAWLPVRSAPE